MILLGCVAIFICLRIAPLQSSLRKVSAPLRSVQNVCHWHTAPTNIRNPLIYCVNRYCLRSASVGAKRTSTGCSAPHVWRVPSSKALSCKHEQLFDLLTLVSYYLSSPVRRKTSRISSTSISRMIASSSMLNLALSSSSPSVSSRTADSSFSTFATR